MLNKLKQFFSSSEQEQTKNPTIQVAQETIRPKEVCPRPYKGVLMSLKFELKQMAKDIRETRRDFKIAMREGTGSYSLSNKLWKIRHEYRHKHVIYSLMRGRQLDQIEKNHREDTPGLYDDYIKGLMLIDYLVEDVGEYRGHASYVEAVNNYFWNK